MSGNQHTIDTCPQNPVLISINKTIDRWDKRMDRQDDLMERQAIAMESIAAHGAEIRSLVTRTDKNELDIEEAFKSIRKIDKRHNIEDGEEIADTRWKRFIGRVFSVPVLMTFCFVWWVSDKFHWASRILAIWKEFRG